MFPQHLVLSVCLKFSRIPSGSVSFSQLLSVRFPQVLSGSLSFCQTPSASLSVCQIPSGPLSFPRHFPSGSPMFPQLPSAPTRCSEFHQLLAVSLGSHQTPSVSLRSSQVPPGKADWGWGAVGEGPCAPQALGAAALSRAELKGPGLKPSAPRPGSPR